MAKLADVEVHFTGDASNLEKTVSNVQKSMLSVTDLVKGDLISSAIKGVAGKVAGIGKSILNVGKSVVGLAASGGMDRALNIEQAQFKLQGLGHDAKSTQQIMDNALASVKGTAYGLDEAATVAASAVAAGVKPGQELERTLKLVGDAATISGRDMGSMGAIFNKVAASGKLTGQELNQLTDSGIPVLQLLGDSLGKTAEEVRDMVSAGEIGFAEFQNAIEKGMGGAALTMGQTFSGSLANLKAALSRIGATVAAPLSQSVTPIMSTITGIFDAINSGTTDELSKLFTDLSVGITNFIQTAINSLAPMLKKAIPIITKTLQIIINVLLQNLPLIMQTLNQLAVQIIAAITQLMPSIITLVTQLLVQLIQLLASNLPMIIQALITGLVTLMNALAKAAPTLIPVVITALIDGLLTILDNIDLIIDAGIQLIMGLIDGIILCLPILIEKMPLIITKMTTAIINNLPKILALGPKIIGKLWTGILNTIPTLVKNMPKIITAIVNAIGKGVSKVGEAGKNIVKGLWNGIKNAKDWVVGKVKDFAKGILKGMKDALGIHSPSKEFAILGKFSVLGYTEALDKMRKDVQQQVGETFGISPQLQGTMNAHYTPNINVTNNVDVTTDPLGQTVKKIKTFSGGAKNDYNYGMGV